MEHKDLTYILEVTYLQLSLSMWLAFILLPITYLKQNC